MYLAIDLGGTKTLVSLLSKTDGTVSREVKFKTPDNYTDFIKELGNTIKDITDGSQIDYTCMAIPGTLDRENGTILRMGNKAWPTNTPIRSDLSKIVGEKIILENDANLAGLGEALEVKDRYNKCLYITTSTGIGGGYIVDGKIDKTIEDAEIGHIKLETDGKLAEWEDLASGAWLVSTYGKLASELEDEEAWKTFSRNFARGINIMINTLTPDIIIIGGGVGAHLEKFKEFLEEQIKILDSGYAKIPPIVKAQKPEEAVIQGCYELIRQS